MNEPIGIKDITGIEIREGDELLLVYDIIKIKGVCRFSEEHKEYMLCNDKEKTHVSIKHNESRITIIPK